MGSGKKRYVLEFSGMLLAYAATLAGTKTLVDDGVVGGDWVVPVALLPVLPCIGMAWVILRHLRQLDEFQKRLQFEAIAFAFTGTALVSFSYGFLEGVGLPKLSMFYVWPLMSVLWIIGLTIACRRYKLALI